MDQCIRMELLLEGLDCANCASKIEKKVNDMESVSSAYINFAAKTLTIEAEPKNNMEDIVSEAKEIIKDIEPEVVIIEKSKDKTKDNLKDNTYEDRNTGDIIKICASSLLIVTAVFMKMPDLARLMVFLLSYVIVGAEAIIMAVKNIIRGQVFDENLLMTIATIGAFSIREYPEGVAVMLFYSIGELFQKMAVNRSRKSIAELMDIRPDYANLKRGSNISKVSPEEVEIGDEIVIKPGEKVPLDGEVIEGRSMVDTSALTGESYLKDVEEGSQILGGFINKNGLLTVRVTRKFGESTVSKILDMVQSAGSKKAATENFITKFARIYTPAVVGASVLLAVIPPLIMKDTSFSDWLHRALVFLVISCPCALVVSIPLSFFGGIGGASKKGILIKGGNFLEALNNLDTIVFDKTGTLTKGVFNVTALYPANNFTKDELLKNAAYCESYSNHPIAVSIIKAYGADINKDELAQYEEMSGLGISAIINGRRVLAGNERLMDKEKIQFQKSDNMSTVVYVAIDGVFAGTIVISDEIKDDSIEAIKNLKSLGIRKTVMLTGDNKKIGEDVGKQIGIDDIYGELLPDQKVEKFEQIEKQRTPGKNIAFVGDGINDAPVLARADIGIAMGGLGSDAAIEAADVVIMNDEPSKIAVAINIAKRTKMIVWENIVFALGIKGLFLIIGALGFTTMWEAVFADVGVTLIAVINSARAMKA